MWKTKHYIEIRDGWGVLGLDLIWEQGIVEEIDWSAVRDTAYQLAEATKNDKRWDIMTDAMKLLEEYYVKSSGISTEEQPRTAN